MGWLDAFIDSVDISLRKLWEIVKNMEAGHATVHGVAKSQTQLSDFHVCVCVCVILFLMIMLSYAINVL